MGEPSVAKSEEEMGLYELCCCQPVYTLNEYLNKAWNAYFGASDFSKDTQGVGEFEIKEFYELCKDFAYLKAYKPGQDYARQGDRPDTLAMVLDNGAGRMDIKDGQKVVGFINAYEWIDGAEYFNRQRPYNYTFTAPEDSEVVVLAWKHKMLDDMERENPHVVGTLKNAIARSLVENMKEDIWTARDYRENIFKPVHVTTATLNS